MNILNRLQQLLEERGWTEYQLSKKCGLAQSTIGNIYRRNTTPSLSTLETICEAFGITMSQFFAEGDLVELTPDIKDLVTVWEKFTPAQRETMIQMMKSVQDET